MVAVGHLDGTPLGTIWAAASETGIVAISLWDDGERFAADVLRLTGELPQPWDAADSPASRLVATALAQLDEYLRGERRMFDVPLDWSTVKPFQRAALEQVCTVGYGQTDTYLGIANRLGRPGAVRAVGQANANNPLPIIIPCHRILGTDGKLHGYGARGGLETKAWLLRLEGSWLL